MRYIAICIALFSLQAGAIEVDKAAHFGAGYICQDLVYSLGFKPKKGEDKIAPTFMAGATCFMLGLAKEAIDSQSCQERTGRFCGLDGGDLGANALGIGTKALLNVSFEF